MPGSGKSSAADILQKLHWKRITFGDLTREELDRRGLPYTQPNERVVREEFRQKHGPGAYAKLLLPTIEENLRAFSIVLDGLYSWAEYRELESQYPSLFVVHIFANREVRYERLHHRKIRPLSPKEAFERDIVEIETLQKGGPIAMANRVVLNNGSPEELAQQINTLIRELET